MWEIVRDSSEEEGSSGKLAGLKGEPSASTRESIVIH